MLNDEKLNEKDIWMILKNYFSINGILKIQLHSFNDYINNGIQSVIDNESDIKIEQSNNQKYIVHFGTISINSPSIIEDDRTLKIIYPSNARQRDLNYDASILCDITETLYENDKIIEQHIHHKVCIGRTPIMVMSDKCNLYNLSKQSKISKLECENDNGGYFIIRGIERVIVAQLRGNYNQVMVFKQKEGEKYSFISEIRSMSEETGHSVQVKTYIGSNNRTILISLPYIKDPIEVGIIFKAFGYVTDEDIENLIGKNEHTEKYIKYILRDSFFIETQHDALCYIGQFAIHIIPKEKRKNYGLQVVETEIFPHLGISSSNIEKALFIGYMINKLILTKLKIRNIDDRDNYANKRVETSGMLCTELFRTLFKRYLNTIKMQIEKKQAKCDIISIVSRLNTITNGLKYCFSTGNWGVQKNAYIRTGVSQVMSRLTYGATLSHMRRVIFPIGKEGKNAKIRQIHTSQFGYICPSETPEGATAGIVLNFSLLCTVTTKIPTTIIKEIVENMKTIHLIKDIQLNTIVHYTYIFINGILIGMTNDTVSFINEFTHLKNTKIIHQNVSISYDITNNEIKIYCDAGRCIRPLFTVGPNGLNIIKKDGTVWNELVYKNLIKYVDNSELENHVVALNPSLINTQDKQTLCEIHPSMLLGVMGNIIPFPDHSPSPRNCYQCSMGKQAIGMYALSYKHRTDTITHVLDYPQKPLVSTLPSQFMGFNEMPSGINAIVAILSYTGYNQEDSVILNKAAIERGMFTVTSYRTISDIEKKNNISIFETICIPPSSTTGLLQKNHGYFKRKYYDYSMLDDRGIVKKGTHVKKGDVIIGKILTTISKTEEKKTDISVIIKQGEEGIVDSIYFSITPNGYKLVKVVIRHQRIPEIGDKVASRAAQKGTIGAIYNQEDMPFTADGITPDIIINPHCIPSRMTTNQLMECVLGKACSLNGTYGDATPWSSNNTTDIICDLLSSAGLQNKSYNKYGWEKLTNGFTGECIKAKVFIGPTYYQRLKHMVADKMHARSKGHVTTLTRQPLEGRSRDGGLRFGEMERDCMIAHGTSRFLKDRLFDCSDPYTIKICDKCGIISSNKSECKSCKMDNITTCNIPYASKLLIQELIAMGIKISIQTKL